MDLRVASPVPFPYSAPITCFSERRVSDYASARAQGANPIRCDSSSEHLISAPSPPRPVSATLRCSRAEPSHRWPGSPELAKTSSDRMNVSCDIPMRVSLNTTPPGRTRTRADLSVRYADFQSLLSVQEVMYATESSRSFGNTHTQQFRSSR